MRPRLARLPALLPAALGALVLPACFDVESRHGEEPGRARLLVARGVVSAASGGTVANPDPEAPHSAVRLEVPAGALAEDTEVTLFVRIGDPRLPQVVQAVEIEPRGLRLLAPATLVVDYGPYYEEAFGSMFPEATIELFSFLEHPRDDSRYHRATFRDTERNLIRATIDRFESFYAMHPDVRRLGLQRARLVDPSVAIPAEYVGGRAEAVHEGAVGLHAGQGSLDSFWSSPSTRNLLVLHGLGDDALGVASPGSIAPPEADVSLNADFDNVVVFEYPSARSLVESGRVLYDALRHGARERFGTRILAHGTGGLVARYALELAHRDTERPSYHPDDPPLSRWIDRAVFVATPHKGTDAAITRFSGVLRATEFDDAEFVAGLLELAPVDGSLVDRLDREWLPPDVRYFAIAGDFAGADHDGLVDVQSALELQSSAGPEAYQVFSGPLYNHVLLTALANRSGVIAQSREWLDKRRDNERPVIGSVETPEAVVAPTIRIPFTLSDPDRDASLVTAEISFDGITWRTARDGLGQPVSLVLPSEPAPGRSHQMAISTAGSGIVVLAPLTVRVRLHAADPFGRGTSGETGFFVVSPASFGGQGNPR